ncbi:MAG: baseplate J/gp47 family protein [Armatimonadota bacterium]|nr:baseplate J/gp47 family protein [bacterium]
MKFVEDNVETIQAKNITRAEAELGRKLYPGDQERVRIGLTSYIQSLVGAAVNFSVNQCRLRDAEGESLDALAELHGITRKPAEHARTTLRFSLAAPRQSVTSIPEGTRATVIGSGIAFASIESAEIAIGDTYVDVIAEADIAGPSANGYLAGEIDQLVDIVSFIAEVSNQTPSADGSDPETDEHFRERIREAPEAYSTAGSEGAYKAMVRASRADADGISIHSPAPRELDIYVTLTNGVIPASETLAEIADYLNDDYRRPMSDVVRINAPTPVQYTVAFSYWINRTDQARVSEIQAAIDAAVIDYILWQRSEIGRDVNPSELTRRLMNAGALRVAITAPVYAALDYSQLAVINGAPAITYEGLSDQ